MIFFEPSVISDTTLPRRPFVICPAARRDAVGRLKTLILFVALVPVWGCDEEESAPSKPPPPTVTVAEVVSMPIVEWDQYTGRLDSIENVEVRARVSGYLESTHFEEGQIVSRGDLLAIIDPRPFEAALTAADASYKEAEARIRESEALLRQNEVLRTEAQTQLLVAKKRYERAKALAAGNAASEEILDTRAAEELTAAASVEGAEAQIESAKAAIATAEAAREIARAEMQTAQLNLQYTRVRAPIDGRISRRMVTQGNLISGGSEQSALLTTIVSVRPIHVYFDANEAEFLKYVRLAKAGKRESSRDVKNPIYLALLDEDGYPHRGHMDFVDNRVDPNTGTMRGRAILANEDGLLTPGLFAQVRLPGSGRYDAVLIPDSAVGSDQSDKFVFVVDQQKQIKRRVVDLGPISHGLRIVRDGLNPGDTIVLNGLQLVRDGQTVQTESGVIEVESGDLPDQYVPVPREQWLSRTPPPTPDDIQSNVAPFRDASVAGVNGDDNDGGDNDGGDNDADDTPVGEVPQS